MCYLFIECDCGHSGTVPWGLERTTLRTEILPAAVCSRCGPRGARDMHIFWNQGANALDGARTSKDSDDRRDW
ncbi:MAG: hypothetical protein CML55_01345 [Rhodobacteraceae bacterium]|nr:hypothetical protein [Paracoccaceae bacterium]MBO28565.1 hypothetical protein [Paracoccaceae bacterium]